MTHREHLERFKEQAEELGQLVDQLKAHPRFAAALSAYPGRMTSVLHSVAVIRSNLSVEGEPRNRWMKRRLLRSARAGTREAKAAADGLREIIADLDALA